MSTCDDFNRMIKKGEVTIAAVRKMAGCDPYSGRKILKWPVSVEIITTMLKTAGDDFMCAMDMFEELVPEGGNHQLHGELLGVSCALEFLAAAISQSGDVMPSPSYQAKEMFKIVERRVQDLQGKMDEVVAKAFFDTHRDKPADQLPAL